MANDAAYEKALEEMKEISPFVAASRSGADFDGEKFRIPFFSRVFLVYHPEIKIVEEDNSAPVPQFLQIILLHYLLQANGVAVADDWISYRQLPGSGLFERRFIQMAVNPLLREFGDDLESLRKVGEAAGGTPMTRTGDAAFRFLALPRIPMACIFYLGEEDISSSVNILFDASAEYYLPTEDLSLLGINLVGAMRKAKAMLGSSGN